LLLLDDVLLIVALSPKKLITKHGMT